MGAQSEPTLGRRAGRGVKRLPAVGDETDGLRYPGQPPAGALERLPPRASPRPAVPALLNRAVGGIFGGLASLRQSRSLHPQGIAFEARFDPVPGLNTGTQLFDERTPQRALLRVSRGLGLPFGVPDWLGVAIRVVDAYGANAHQDFLLVSSRPEPLARHSLLPATSFLGTRFSSISPYRIGRDRMVIGATVTAERLPGLGDLAEFQSAALFGDVRLELQAATMLGPWVTTAALVIDRLLPATAADQLRFNPWNTGGSIRPDAPWDLLRDGAYRASQLGWPGPHKPPKGSRKK